MTPLLLDLVNSRIVYPDGPRDELADDDDARAWLRERGALGTREEIADARTVRPVLAAVIRGEAPLDALAPWVAVMHRRARLTSDGLSWQDDVPADRRVGVRAIEEWAALQGPDGSRIRPCADPDCQHFLVDHSRANARKWHSMEICGNRAKARRHYARSKERDGGLGSAR
ncbi:CGNR zinc finger domain-containing protein [Jiangella rhizosphaerae]|uniref:Zf-CGNR multi-domain protein n=1 Tax=Jiangella rhizosphaerae TaxID=2293569 RepID=A0A418KGQ3_9ACTN|nr:CGNR zinc finger domain-containing protein [Jiangella rhizosphaerae]RIQ11241.1 zf-CGNR multi-domain protein [Jiangella rhizosphaerae]